MTKNTANKAITNPIRPVVPQPGATFPYSEFSGFIAVPSAVTFALPMSEVLFAIGLLSN